MESEIKFKLAPKPITAEVTVASIEQIAMGMANARVNMQEILAPFQRSFEQAAAAVRAITDFHEKLRQGIQQWVLENQEGLLRMAKLAAAAMAEFERYRNEEEAEAFSLMSREGWSGMDRHFSLSHMRDSVILFKTEGKAAMNDFIADYFNENDCEPLTRMSQSWVSIPYLRDRQETIQEAVTAHKLGLFTLTAPALLPLVEGLSGVRRQLFFPLNDN